jgi:hypothetical protein
MENVSPVLYQFDYLLLIGGIIGLYFFLIDDESVYYMGVGINLCALFRKFMLLAIPILSFATFLILHFDL